MAFVLTAPMVRLVRPVAAGIVVYVLVDVGVQVGSPLAPVTEYVAPASVPPVYTTTAVTAGDNSEMFSLVCPHISSTAVEPVAPRVVVSLPPVEMFSAPVYDQVHQELVASSEMTENFAEIPVVHEHVIVQDIPEVIVPLPPAQEFSAPVYGQVHQVFVGMRPERLVDARGPQRCVRTVPSVGAPILAVQSLRGFDGVEFLLQLAVKLKEKERGGAGEERGGAGEEAGGPGGGALDEAAS